MKNFVIILFFGCLLISQTSKAQDFVYTPKNPAFGGSYFNYSWMLSSAQAQNTIEEEQDDIFDRYESDPLEDFEESLNRQILSRLSREIVTQQFGSESFDEGKYILGDYQIDITEGLDGMTITIVDNATGGTTTISVPMLY